MKTRDLLSNARRNSFQYIFPVSMSATSSRGRWAARTISSYYAGFLGMENESWLLRSKVCLSSLFTLFKISYVYIMPYPLFTPQSNDRQEPLAHFHRNFMSSFEICLLIVFQPSAWNECFSYAHGIWSNTLGHREPLSVHAPSLSTLLAMNYR